MSQPEHDPQNPPLAGGATGPGQPAAPGFRGYEQQPDAYGQQPAAGYGPPATPGYDPQQLSYGYGEPAPAYGQQPYGYGHTADQLYGQPGYGYGAGPGGAPTLDQPAYGIGPVDAVKRGFAKYARFDGRASRGEYWWWTLVLTVAFTALIILTYVLGAATLDSSGEPSALVAIPGLILVIGGLAVLVPSIAVSVRRLHDADYSGWLYLLTLTSIGSLVLIVFFALPAKPSGARFDRRLPAGGYPG